MAAKRRRGAQNKPRPTFSPGIVSFFVPFAPFCGYSPFIVFLPVFENNNAPMESGHFEKFTTETRRNRRRKTFLLFLST
jgi:hypothetical protein